MLDLLIRAAIAIVVAGFAFVYGEKLVQGRKTPDAQHGVPEPEAREADE